MLKMELFYVGNRVVASTDTKSPEGVEALSHSHHIQSTHKPSHWPEKAVNFLVVPQWQKRIISDFLRQAREKVNYLFSTVSIDVNRP